MEIEPEQKQKTGERKSKLDIDEQQLLEIKQGNALRKQKLMILSYPRYLKYSKNQTIIDFIYIFIMDTTDAYTSRRLLYKCDNSITKIYANLFKMMSPAENTAEALEEQIKYDTIKQLQTTIFQNFKYTSALKSLQKDMQDNQQLQFQADKQIEKSRQQIKNLMDEVKSAEIVKKRKLQYNEIAKSVKQFNTCNELSNKISEVETQVEKLNNQYQNDMDAYSQKQRLLRMALSALRALKPEQQIGGFNQSPVSYS